MAEFIPWGERDPDQTLDERITERRWDVWGDDGRPYPADPKWVRGELRTRERRRARIRGNAAPPQG